MNPTSILIAASLALVSCGSPDRVTTTPMAPSGPGRIVAAPSKPKARPASLVNTVKPVAPDKPKPYPLKKCLVSDEPLDEWDDLQTIVYQGQEMKFCCKMCLKKFNKDPEKYLEML